ncbi:MAG: flavodoxin family protein [Sedimentisphaerales bacterium]|nr:flavodoxin family protein [Sedimentisphaerales bacterium]
MSKKVVAIVGTYRKGRVIDTAVDEILRGAEEHGAQTMKISLPDKHIEFCTNCRECTQQENAGARGQCVQQDDLAEILKEVEQADVLVLAAPVNFASITAITKRFLERLLGSAYWPWGTAIPKFRLKRLDKSAIIVTSSACPALLARIMMRSPLQQLKAMARCLGAKVVGTLYFGQAARTRDQVLDEKNRRKAYLAGVMAAR